MGRKGVELSVIATLSDHNDERDVADEASWEDLAERVKALVAEPKYAEISAMVFR